MQTNPAAHPNTWTVPASAPTATWSPTGHSDGPPVKATPWPPAKMGWFGAVLATAALVVLGGVLPLYGGSSVRLVHGSGAIYVAGIAVALCALAVDLAIGSGVALPVAGGVATIVLSVSGTLLGIVVEWHRSIHVGAGTVFLILAALPSLVLIAGGVLHSAGRTRRPVHPALAVACASGALITAIGMLIPPIPHETIKQYLFGGPAVVDFFFIVPVILTVACAVLAVAFRTAGSLGVAVGNATAMLAVWGAGEITRTQAAQGIAGFINGEWVVVLIGVALCTAAGVWALIAPSTVAGSVGREPLNRRSGVTPALAAVAALIIIPLAVVQHGRTDTSSPVAAGVSGSSRSNSSSGGIDNSTNPYSSGSSSGGSYSSSGGSPSSGSTTYGTTPSTDQPTVTTAGPDASTVMSELAGDLSKSAAVRPNVQNAINDIQSCNGSPSNDEAAIQDAINTRQLVLSDLQNLDGSNLDNGSQLISDLMAAMNDSITADEGFLGYIRDVASGTINCNADPTTDNNYNAGMSSSAQATSDKTSFVQLWNPAAPQYNEQTYQAGDF